MKPLLLRLNGNILSLLLGCYFVARFLGGGVDRVLGTVLPVSRKGTTHRFYLRRAGDSGRWGLFIHHIVSSDKPELFHNHPWDGLALVFGSYVEETPTDPPRRVWLLNRIGHRRSHRVKIDRPVWTIFLHFSRQSDGAWWFHDRAGRRLEVNGETVSPWRGPDRKAVA